MECPYFDACGGCSLPRVPYPEQLTRKRATLQRLLGIPVPPLVPSSREEAFRHKVAFVFGSDASGRRIVMGHYAPGSRRIVPVDACPVHSERGNQLAFRLRDQLTRAQVSPHLLRHVIVRTTESGREASMTLVVSRNDKSLRRPIRAFLELADGPDGFFVNINDRPGPLMVGRETLKVSGRSHVREDAVGPSFLIGPTSFFQTNVLAARELVRLVLAAVGGASRVFDLYCGAGLFTVPLAAQGTRVTGVEENADAIDDARRNLKLNGLEAAPVRLLAARVEDALARLRKDLVDVVIIDPPRQGCAPPVIPTITGDVRPPRLVYVSCNPAVLAADLPRLRAAGYQPVTVQPLDMFPHTDHIETVVTLDRRS